MYHPPDGGEHDDTHSSTHYGGYSRTRASEPSQDSYRMVGSPVADPRSSFLAPHILLGRVHTLDTNDDSGRYCRAGTSTRTPEALFDEDTYE